LSASIPVVQTINSPEWNADFYGALSSVSRLAVAVKNKANVLKLAYALRNGNRSLKALFDQVDAVMDGTAMPLAEAEMPSPQRLFDTADTLMKLSRDIDYIYELLRCVGLTNNSLMAGSLAAFHQYRGRLEDLADWLELAAQSDDVRTIFERASAERERGEIVDLERV
jgi:hypothetical protein